jgi:peptidoglycan/LPS O-acetylase OafA/YrhL
LSPVSHRYRPDVDGLRAIAVLSVVIFHIRGTLLPGGFVGVDIFFVISGFLITRNICQDLDSGRFSIIEFYRRRIKRIMPAMLAVVLVTLLSAQLLMLPEDAKAAAKSAVFSLFSLANVYFWYYQDTSYFSPGSAQLPLLHLWSLGVEEQFYLVWPLILVAFYRPRKVWLVLLMGCAAAIGSFYLGQELVNRGGSAASFSYYMLPTRAGELLLGGLIASASLKGIERRIPGPLVAPIALTGALLLMLSLFLLSETSPFPGWRAVPPTLGAALLILAGHCGRNRLSGALATSPMVWIGKVSYSAYLWHWPILALYRYGYGTVSDLAGTGIFLLTFGVAWLSYRLIEEPLRRSPAPASKVFAFQYAVPAGLIAALAILFHQLGHFGISLHSRDYRARLAEIESHTQPTQSATQQGFPWVCQDWRISPADLTRKECLLGRKSGDGANSAALLWGDSQAAHYIGVIDAIATAGGFQFRNVAASACPPLFSDLKGVADHEDDCRASLELIRPAASAYPVVILAAAWATYQYRSDAFMAALFDTVRHLTSSGKLVILMGQVPNSKAYDRFCTQKALSYPFKTCTDFFYSIPAWVSGPNERLRRFAETTPNVRYFDVTEFVCPADRCSAYGSDGELRFYNDTHLSVTGAARLGQDIVAREGVPAAFSEIAGRTHRDP